MAAELSTAKNQLLHLVLGGELTELGGSEFKDLEKIDVVGIFPNYASAYVAWKAKAQQTVDNALPTSSTPLLDPEATGRPVR